jgi:hypothetical protein
VDTHRETRTVRPGFRGHLAAWSLSPRLTASLIVVPLLLMAFAVLAAITAPTAWIALTDEDWLVEWLQVLALTIAGAGFFLVGYREWRIGGRLVPVVHVLIGVASMVVALEEISWGQRLFGWATPPLFDEINYQHETNIHNTVALESVMKLTEIGVGAFGTLAPIAAMAAWAPGWLRSSVLVPPIALLSFFAIPFLHWSSRIFIDPNRPIARLSEAAELALFTGGALFAAFCLRRLASEADHQRGRARRVGPELGRGRA